MVDLTEFVNSRVSVWIVEAQLYRNLRAVNKIAIYILCPISHFFVFYMIILYAKKNAIYKSYRSVLIIASTIDLFLTIVNGWCLVYPRTEGSAYIFFMEGPVKYTPVVVQWLSLAAYLCSTIAASTILIVEFLFRHFIVKHRVPPGLFCLFKWMFVAVSLALIHLCYTLYNCCVLNRMEDGAFKMFDYTTGGNDTVILIYSSEKSIFPWFQVYYRRSIMVASFFVSMLIAFMSVRLMKKQTAHLSNKAKTMQRDFSRTLYLKNAIPAILVVSPIIGRMIFTLLNMDGWIWTEITSWLNAFLPFLNSILNLILITYFRRQLLCQLQNIYRAITMRSNSVTVMSHHT
ncbi:hypothetical protein M3Y96_00545100 [Aphelenchoides besseyi]|nr:hypothetical protein M3Y96_00545100 [Aphelenchoides besseyi]